MTLHELKCWPPEFQAVDWGTKSFEIRDGSDRDFQQGDSLHLREYCPEKGTYTGRWIVRTVTYVVKGPVWNLPPNLVVMSLV